VNQHKLSRLFLNVVRALQDLHKRGINIKYIVPEAILVNIETGDAKLLLQKSTLLKVSPLSLLDSFSILNPPFDTLRY
jgi:hypothetical protein